MDHVADRNGVELTRLAQLYDFPKFVKQANMEVTLNPASTVAVTAFADPRHREFPCHTAASTWLSALYFQEKRAEFHPKDQARIESSIDHYAGYWRIKEAVTKMRGRWKELHKEADSQLPDSAYAWVWAGENGHKDRRLPLRNAMEVKVAAEWLHKHCDRVPFSDRHVIATKILEKRARFGASVGPLLEFIEKQAGQGVCDPGEVIEMIENRAMLAQNPELRNQFKKMAATVASAPAMVLQPDTLVKLAETMDKLDRNLGIVGKYSEALPRPEDVIFKVTFGKAASATQQVVALTTGKTYEKTAFKRLAASDLTELFGQEFAERVCTPLGEVDPEKMAEEAHTLPRPDAQLLDGLLSENGIRPLMHKAASVRQGLTEEQLTALANQYA
jgi:hypothetical protein